MASKNIITDKVVIDNLAGNGNVEVDVNPGQTVIKAAAIELTGTLTNNGQPISGGGGSTVTVTQVLSSGTKIATVGVDGTDTDLYAPTAPTVGNGKLSIHVNGRTELSQGFSANQSENTTAYLTTGLYASTSSSSNVNLSAQEWRECTGTVSTFSIVAGSDYSTSEYAGAFTTGSSQTSVTFTMSGSLSGYTMNWIEGDPSDLESSTKYIFSLIVPRSGSSISNAYGIIKKVG